MAQSNGPPIEGFSEGARRFIATYIDSVARLELLLLLRSQPEREFSAADVSQELRMTPVVMETHLAGLEVMGLAKCVAPGSGRYRYALRQESLEPVVAELAQAYVDRRVSLITQIYSPAADPIRSFADAFRWRKEH
jgi:predicted ArsR family transcriptional regulator